MNGVSLNSLLEFIEKHPAKDRVVKDYTKAQIAESLSVSLKEKALAVITDGRGNIEGICAGQRADDYRLLHIKILLVKPNSKNTVALLLEIFNKNFPGYDIQAFRRDNLTRYKNTPRLVKLLKLLAN